MTDFTLQDNDAEHVARLVLGLVDKDDVLERVVSNNNAGLSGEVPRETLLTMGRVIVAQIIGAGGGN
jgi:hypothetical protein